MPTLGIDIGGSCVKTALMEGDKVLWQREGPSYSFPATEQLVTGISAAIQRPLPPLTGVGLCVPGLLDRAAQMVTAAVNVPGLVGIALPKLVQQVLGAAAPKLVIANDANAAGYDIWAARKLNGRVLVLAIGTGVGASVIDGNGQFVQVDGESPGHIGQVDVSIEGCPIIGPDGGAGGLEGYLGGPAIKKHYNADARQVVESWTGDEPGALALARAIRICHAIYRPQHVCLAGGLGIRMKKLVEPLHARASKDLTSVARPGWTLTVGDDEHHAARGMARLAAAV